MVQNKTRSNRDVLYLIGLGVVGFAIGGILFLTLHHTTKDTIQNAAAAKHAPQTSLTAGGKPVPVDSVTRARKLGYYCPSWDAKADVIASDICIPLDK